MGDRQEGAAVSVPEISLRLALIEAQHLSGLVDQLTSAIAAADETIDPAIARLTPAPYPDDAEAAREFAAATRDDLLDRRTADAAVVRRALGPFLNTDTAAPDGAGPAPEHIDVSIRRIDIDSWLRTLTALRLVLATRLRITDDDQYDDEDPRFGVYDWLGYRLDGLVEIADALDAPRGEG